MAEPDTLFLRRPRPAPAPPPPMEAVADRQRQSNAGEAQEVEMQVMPAPIPGVNPVLRLMRKLATGIVEGTDLQQYQGEIERFIGGQAERAQAFDSLSLTNDYGRLVQFQEVREKLEAFMLACANRGDLSPTETLSFMEYVDEQEKRASDRIRAGATDVKDIVSLLEKMDHLHTLNQRDFEQRLSATTPMGREIVRRSAIKLSKLARAGRRVPYRQTVSD